MKHLLPLLGLAMFLLPASRNVQAQSVYSDCSTARVICNMSPLQLPGASGGGAVQESFANACFPAGFSETNSMWFKWKIATSGALKFTILPFDETDDVDFALFRISSLEHCAESWELVRCSAAGPNLGDESYSPTACTGATGLNESAEGTVQYAGCPEDAVNFLMPVNAKQGEYYALMVNNYKSTAPFALEWGGACTFEEIPETCQNISTGVTNVGANGFIASSLYPNPSAEEVTLDIECDHARSCNVQLISTGGQIHLSYFTDLPAGRNTVKLPTQTLNPGVYFIKIKSENDTRILRFAKQ